MYSSARTLSPGPDGPVRRVAAARTRVLAGLVLAGLVLVSCAGPSSTSRTDSPSGEQATMTPEPSAESEPSKTPSGSAQASPTGTPALSEDERRGMLRVRATAFPQEGTCAPEQFTAEVSVQDEAMGTRFGTLTLRHVGGPSCTLSGYPGWGARGRAGTVFQNDVTQAPATVDFGRTGTLPNGRESLNEPGPSDPPAITVQPGEQVRIPLNWGDALDGTVDPEPLEHMVLQLASGQTPLEVAGADDPALDLRAGNRVEIGPFQFVWPAQDSHESEPGSAEHDDAAGGTS